MRALIAGLLSLLASSLAIFKGITIPDELLDQLATAILTLVAGIMALTAHIKTKGNNDEGKSE